MSTIPIDSPSDTELLRQYTASRSPQAFAALVERYLPLIYSSALRQTRDPHLAEDISQATLIVFSQRAARIDPPILVGWLLKTTHFVARNALRQQFRRARYEQRAAAMKSETQTSTGSADAISNVIDPALAKLRDADRTAIVLRYFQNKSFADIAAMMDSTEAAVQKRISRSVQKLRDILSRQGAILSPAALPPLLAAQIQHPIPPSLARQVATAPNSSSSLIAKGAIKAMAATKTKIALGIVIAIGLAGGSLPVIYHYEKQTAQNNQIQATPIAWVPKGTDLSKPVAGTLPAGLKVRLIAIMRISDGKWISPTGQEPSNLPSDADTRLNDLHTSAAYALLYSIVNSGPDVTFSQQLMGVRFRGMIGWHNFFSMPYTLDAFDPADGSDSVSLVIDAADGPWKQVALMPASSTMPVDVTINGISGKLFPPTEDGQGVHVECTRSDLPGASLRLYAVGIDGKSVNYNYVSNNGSHGTFTFPGSLANYKEFRVQSRPYNHHATFPAVPLPR